MRSSYTPKRKPKTQIRSPLLIQRRRIESIEAKQRCEVTILLNPRSTPDKDTDARNGW